MGILDKLKGDLPPRNLPPRRGLGILLAIKKKSEDKPEEEEEKGLSDEDKKQLGEELFKKLKDEDALGLIETLKNIIKVLDKE